MVSTLPITIAVIPAGRLVKKNVSALIKRRQRERNQNKGALARKKSLQIRYYINIEHFTNFGRLNLWK